MYIIVLYSEHAEATNLLTEKIEAYHMASNIANDQFNHFDARKFMDENCLLCVFSVAKSYSLTLTGSRETNTSEIIAFDFA